ncbi:MAG: amino acid ABC transporter substrate-binding protein [Chloroflexi bacterium]|nr:amino acid ABC transporter substrate-binding protein [Chloroflexota bacterium]
MAAATRRRFALIAVALALVAALIWLAVDPSRRESAPLFRHGALRIGVDASYPPFAFLADDQLHGLDVDLGRALADELDIPAQFVLLGFDGLYDGLQTDQVDVLISALRIDPGRQVHYSLPYFDAGLALVSAAGRDFTTMAALSGHALAFEFGSEAHSEANRWLRRIQPFETRPYELPAYALDAVRLGHADAALVDAVSARLYLRDQPDWGAQMSVVRPVPLAIATRIDRLDRALAVNEALAALIEDGTVAALIDRWL